MQQMDSNDSVYRAMEQHRSNAINPQSMLI